MRKNFLTLRVMELWNRLTREAVDSPLDPPGQGPVQPAIGDPALAGGVGLDDPQRSLSTPNIL